MVAKRNMGKRKLNMDSNNASNIRQTKNSLSKVKKLKQKISTKKIKVSKGKE